MTNNNRSILLIDGANTSWAMQSIGKRLDWRALRGWFDKEDDLISARYYTAILEEDDGKILIQPMIDWLSYNGYIIIKKGAKKFYREDGSTKVKGNMDIELTTDMIRFAPRISALHLFTGDSDFTYAIKTVQEMGVSVYVYSTLKGKTSVAGDELRRQADWFQDIADFPEELFQEPKSVFVKESNNG